MATGKRYYWIKLKKEFLTGDAIEYLMSHERGSDYVVLYLQLCTATINTCGRLESRIGEMIIKFDVARIQREGRYFSRETVEKALDLYKCIGLIYEKQDGTLIIADYSEMVGSETDWAAQKRRQKGAESDVENGVENFHTESESIYQSQRLENRFKSTKKEKERSESVSVSSSIVSRTCTRESVDVLSGFLYIHGIKLSKPDVNKLFEDGFDLDTIFWMIEKTEEARPINPTSYFSRICEDKYEKNAMTIDIIRKEECDSPDFCERFDKHVQFWQEEFSNYQEFGEVEYAKQRNEKMRRYMQGNSSSH